MTKKITTVPIEHKVLAVIDNFQCDLPEIELSKNLSIRRIDTLPDDEKAAFSGEEQVVNVVSMTRGETEKRRQTFRFITYHSANGEVFQRTLERGNYVLRWHIKERIQQPLREHYDFLAHPREQLGAALSALRVLKAGVVGLYPSEDFLIDLPLPKQFLSRSTDRVQDSYQLSDPANVTPYTLMPEEVETLLQLLIAVKAITQPGLQTALSRLHHQYSRTVITDRLIDAVIALEALYAGDNFNEIAFRVGLRISAHLGGNDADQRERYFDLVNLAYNLRSRLVHGAMHKTAEIEKEVKKKGWQDSDAFMAALDDMLRQSLRYVLLHVKNGKLRETLHEPLDKAIRRGETFSLPSV